MAQPPETSFANNLDAAAAPAAERKSKLRRSDNGNRRRSKSVPESTTPIASIPSRDNNDDDAIPAIDLTDSPPVAKTTKTKARTDGDDGDGSPTDPSTREDGTTSVVVRGGEGAGAAGGGGGREVPSAAAAAPPAVVVDASASGGARAAASVIDRRTPPPPPPKKRLSFHDQILHAMLTSCRPYTLRTLASATNTTVEALRHAMLSFLDKGLVVCKEFPSKGGGGGREPKCLYWANPASLSDIEAGGGGGGGGAVVKELSRLLSTTSEIGEARDERRRLERRHRDVLAELDPLISEPTIRQLDDEIEGCEAELRRVREEIDAARRRMSALGASAADAGPRHPSDRLHGPQRSSSDAEPPRMEDTTTIKRKINHMLGEYKARKRKCMDFVEELSEAMEKKTRDVLGDKVLCLDTDEDEWGMWEDMSTGKVFGTKPKQSSGGGGLGGKFVAKNDGEEIRTVKIPARYADV
ncbi:hypothetical protein ACHAW5_002040 [Stephanodiscus triporus]|uniref:Homologous-pairing protein 2 homolog n=1 Tax=Stephanodiscus triporus TaxID=2934178 RepID=A0ABD3QKA8_9STRA